MANVAIKLNKKVISLEKMCGQALLELSFAVSLLSTLLIIALPMLHQALKERAQVFEQSVLILHQADWRAQLGIDELTLQVLQEDYAYTEIKDVELQQTRTADYAFNSMIQPVTNIVSTYSQLNLDVKNLYTVHFLRTEQEKQPMPWIQLTRLDNDWSPRKQQDLVNRPKSLVTGSLLQKLGVHRVLNIIGHLSIAKEWRSSSLKLGHVNIDVVPDEVLCKRRECHDY